MSEYKWPKHNIEQVFKGYKIRPNWNKVRRFQRYTDDMDTCVKMCVASIRNDREEAERRLSHETGAY